MNRRDFLKAASVITTGGIIAGTAGCDSLHDIYNPPVTAPGPTGPTGPTATTPDQFTGLTLWLKADAGVIQTGGAVSQWQDQSGNAVVVSQVAGPSQPTLVTGAIGGQPAIQFNDASSQCMQFDGSFLIGTAYSIISVIKITAPKNSNIHIGAGINSLNAGIALGYLTTTAYTHSHYQGADVAFNSTASGAGEIFSNTFSATTLKVHTYKNGLLESLGSGPGMASLSAFSPAYLGRNMTNYFRGDIAEIIIYNKELTDDERQGVELYLSNKYTITLA